VQDQLATRLVLANNNAAAKVAHCWLGVAEGEQSMPSVSDLARFFSFDIDGFGGNQALQLVGEFLHIK
jgi:hypothetical protein